VDRHLYVHRIGIEFGIGFGWRCVSWIYDAFTRHADACRYVFLLCLFQLSRLFCERHPLRLTLWLQRPRKLLLN
jgi:hypothetical protein